MANPNPKRVPRGAVWTAIRHAVLTHNIEGKLITGNSRTRPIVAARWCAWRYLYERGFGPKAIQFVWPTPIDHTSIINARDRNWSPYESTLHQTGADASLTSSSL